jgi:tripartite-type tricarboxylate transporter receptor subunit TctC
LDRALGAKRHSRRRRPGDVVTKLNTAIVDILADTNVRARIDKLGHEVFPRQQQTPKALAAFHRSEIDKWWPIAKAAGIKVN